MEKNFNKFWKSYRKDMDARTKKGQHERLGRVEKLIIVAAYLKEKGKLPEDWVHSDLSYPYTQLNKQDVMLNCFGMKRIRRWDGTEKRWYYPGGPATDISHVTFNRVIRTLSKKGYITVKDVLYNPYKWGMISYLTVIELTEKGRKRVKDISHEEDFTMIDGKAVVRPFRDGWEHDKNHVFLF